MNSHTEARTPATLAEKLKAARKGAGLTQEELAARLMVSRQAVTKWESGKGLPDVENLKALAQLLDVSIDHLLDDGTSLDLSVTRQPISLDDYSYRRHVNGRWVRKAGLKDQAVLHAYPHATIHWLMGSQKQTRQERILDNVLGFLMNAPFGLPAVVDGFRNSDKEFYLVTDAGRQYLVTVFDDYLESHRLPHPVTSRTFEIGDFRFTDCGPLPETARP